MRYQDSPMVLRLTFLIGRTLRVGKLAAIYNLAHNNFRFFLVPYFFLNKMKNYFYEKKMFFLVKKQKKNEIKKKRDVFFYGEITINRLRKKKKLVPQKTQIV